MERDARRVGPERLEVVVAPPLRIEEVDDHVAEVEQDPAVAAGALDAAGLAARGGAVVRDAVGDGAELAAVPRGRDHEVVGDHRPLLHVEEEQVLAPLVDGDFGAAMSELERIQIVPTFQLGPSPTRAAPSPRSRPAGADASRSATRGSRPPPLRRTRCRAGPARGAAARSRRSRTRGGPESWRARPLPSRRRAPPAGEVPGGGGPRPRRRGARRAPARRAGARATRRRARPSPRPRP